MNRRSRSVLVAIGLALTLSITACGGGDDGDGASATGKATTTTVAAQQERQKPAAGTGNVQGTVLFDDEPASGIAVRLCGEYSSILGTCTGAVFTATTGADGVFVLADVTPGEYQGLLAKVFDTPYEIFLKSGVVSARTYTVTADKTLFVDATHLFKSDLRVTNPASGSSVPPTGLEVRWDAYPSATHYKLTLTAKEISTTSPVVGQRVDGTSFTVTAPLPAGEYRVRIEAFNAKDRKLAEAPEGYSFMVRA